MTYKTCVNCGCKLRESGRCGWCEEGAVILYEQQEYHGSTNFSDEFIEKANKQERKRH